MSPTHEAANALTKDKETGLSVCKQPRKFVAQYENVKFFDTAL